MSALADAIRYPNFICEVGFHRHADGGQLHVSVQAPALRVRTNGTTQETFRSHAAFEVDGFLIDYLSAIDGLQSVSQLRTALLNRYGPLFGSVLAERAEAWLIAHPELIDVADHKAEVSARPQVTGSVDGYFPLHCSFEIIETCNFTCDHCYYQSSPFKKGRISLELAIDVMDRLSANGVRVIELTGGECTIHPSFAEILAYASKTFDLVGIITNGYRLGTSDKLAEFVCRIPNLIAQVSIDAIGGRHDSFRKHRGAFDAAVNAIRRLVAAGVVTRMASSISDANIEEIVPLYHLAKSLGVQKIAFTSIAALGRGCNISDPGAGPARVSEAIGEALAPFADEPALNHLPMREYLKDGVGHAIGSIPSELVLPRNCGAGWQTVTVDYDGHVRACNYSRDSKRFGNILTDEYSTLYSQQASFMFRNAPSPGGRDCDGCTYRGYCVGCFVKAFMVSEAEYPECPWRRKWFPDMVLGVDQRSATEATDVKRRSLPMYTDADHPMACSSCAGKTDGLSPCGQPVAVRVDCQ